MKSLSKYTFKINIMNNLLGYGRKQRLYDHKIIVIFVLTFNFGLTNKYTLNIFCSLDSLKCFLF